MKEFEIKYEDYSGNVFIEKVFGYDIEDAKIKTINTIKYIYFIKVLTK